MSEQIGQIPDEAKNFSMENKNIDDKEEENRGSLKNRLKSKAKQYAKIALITVATFGPVGSMLAEKTSATEGDKIENVDNKKELTEEEKSLIKEMQQLANNKAEQISKDNPDISIEEIDKFQQQAWDMAGFIVENGGDVESYEYSLSELAKSTFINNEVVEEKSDGNFSEQEKSFLKEMQQEANKIIESMDKELDIKNPEKLDKFQQLLWDFAAYIVKNDGDMDSFQYGVNEFKNKHFADEISQAKSEQIKNTEQVTKLVAPEVLEDSVEINEEWMWNNVGKVFRKGDTILVVQTGKSRDMQLSVNKASLEGRAVLAELLKQEKGGSNNQPTTEVLIHSRNRVMDIKQDGKFYNTVVVMEMPFSDNIK